MCIGETLEEREAEQTFDVIKEQLDASLKNFRADEMMPPSTILAYEPVWAIGTGRTATPEQAQEVHHFIREWIENRHLIQRQPLRSVFSTGGVLSRIICGSDGRSRILMGLSWVAQA